MATPKKQKDKDSDLFISMAIRRKTHRRIRIYAALHGLRLPDAIDKKFEDVQLPE